MRKAGSKGRMALSSQHFRRLGKGASTPRLRAPTDVSEGAALKRTYFGLEIINGNLVRLSDIEALPFVDFWRMSSSGSTMLVDTQTGQTFVYLHDWEAFAELFIRTGKHRFQPRSD